MNECYETLSEAEGRHLGMGERRACCPLNFVRMGGLEPPRRKAPDPKSGLSTNFNTSASSGAKIRKKNWGRRDTNETICYICK